MAPPEQTNAEAFYYSKQMSAKTPMVVVLLDGEILHGVIEWYDKDCVKVNRGCFIPTCFWCGPVVRRRNLARLPPVTIIFMPGKTSGLDDGASTSHPLGSNASRKK